MNEKKNKEYNNYGTVQLVLLGKHLKENGFTLWSLGHDIPYKKALGAEICERECFLERWFASNKYDYVPMRPYIPRASIK